MKIKRLGSFSAVFRGFPGFVWLILTATLSLASTLAVAESQDSSLTAQDYGALPARSMLTISPNGSMIAFRAVEDDRDLVMVYSLKQGKMLTGADVSGISPRYLYFVNDDHLIMVVSEVKKLWGYRGVHDISTGYSLNTKTGEVQQLLRPGDNIVTGQSGLGSIVGLSPGHTHAYMPAYVGRSAQDRNPRYSLMRVSLKSPRSPRVHAQGHPDTINYFVDQKGEVLAEERFSNRRNLHTILVPDGRSWREIYQHETSVRDIAIRGVTPDQKSLVVLTTNAQTGRTDYYTMSLADGAMKAMGLGRADADVEHFLTDLNQVVYGIVYSGFKPTYQLFDEAVDKRVRAVQEQFAGHAVHLRDWSHDWRHLVFYVEGPSTSGDYYLASQGKALQYLTSARPNIPAESVHPVAIFEYPARDKLTIPALLTFPKERVDSPENLPTIVMPHGGPHAYDAFGFDWLAQAFAERGYLVVQPQFRGSTGFGATHWAAGHGEWGRKMQDDLTDAVHFLVSAGFTDAQRVCIVGGSYGGYAALAGAAFTPDLYRCAVSVNGVSDIGAFTRSDRKRFGKDHWVLSYFEESITKGDFNRERIDAISPARFATQFNAPVLLIHGERDERVPIEQSEIMHRNLSRAGKTVEFVELKGENHYLLQGETRLEAMVHMLAFVDKHMAPALTEVAEE